MQTADSQAGSLDHVPAHQLAQPAVLPAGNRQGCVKAARHHGEQGLGNGEVCSLAVCLSVVVPICLLGCLCLCLSACRCLSAYWGVRVCLPPASASSLFPSHPLVSLILILSLSLSLSLRIFHPSLSRLKRQHSVRGKRVFVPLQLLHLQPTRRKWGGEVKEGERSGAGTDRDRGGEKARGGSSETGATPPSIVVLYGSGFLLNV